MDEPTSRDVTHKFSYIFTTPPGSFYPPLMTEHRLHLGRPVTIDGPGGAIDATPFRLDHGDMDALGFRFGNIAYTPDLHAIPPESARFLEGLDLWIIDALRWQRHGTHLSVEQALALIDRYRPRRAVLTDLHVDLDYDALAAVLPANVVPAYHGLRLEV
jgi:phosphoribosyl 1,2-cyclic phosphate phosphodiesterase